MGGLFSTPNDAGVSDCATSRIGTRTSGREPSTNIFFEFGSGCTAALSTCASRAKNLSLAFMALLKQLRSVGRGAVRANFELSTLPCAGIIRTGTKGVISPPRHSIARGPLASLRTLLQSVGVSNSATFFGAGRHRVAGARLTGHQK